MRSLLCLLFCLSSLLFLGCVSHEEALPTFAGTYVLRSVGETTFDNKSPAFMRVAGDSISGKGPVNQWSAQIEDGEVTGVISTRKAGPPEWMAVEKELFAALEGAKIKTDGANNLRFTKGMKTVATFEAVTMPLPR